VNAQGPTQTSGTSFFSNPLLFTFQAGATSDFSLVVPAVVTVPAGGSTQIQVGVQSQGFTGSVALTSSDSNLTFGQSSINAPGSVTASYNAGSLTARSPFDVYVYGNDRNHFGKVTVNIQSTSPGATSIQSGCPNGCGQYAIPNDGQKHRVTLYNIWYSAAYFESCTPVAPSTGIGIAFVSRSTTDPNSTDGTYEVLDISVPVSVARSTQQMTCKFASQGTSPKNSNP
jgi:hypothetical protein